jgi:hypothetical protein
MFKRKEVSPSESELYEIEATTQPFYYEIRVKGRLSQEQWMSWFDNLAISVEKGESILRGTLADHSALYGLLARLRDLAIPLLSVNVLDAEAQRKLLGQSRRFELMNSLLLILVYLLLLGGLITLTVFATSVIHTALALVLLFAALGGIAYALFIWSGKRIWRYLAYFMWPAAVLTFLIYLATAELLHPALAIMTMLLLSAGGIIYLIYYLQGRAEKIDDVIVEWETLGGNADEDEVQVLKTGQKLEEPE